MDEILKELEITYQLISSIPVTNDSVDAMAAARARLRKIHTELKAVSMEPPGKGETNE